MKIKGKRLSFYRHLYEISNEKLIWKDTAAYRVLLQITRKSMRQGALRAVDWSLETILIRQPTFYDLFVAEDLLQTYHSSRLEENCACGIIRLFVDMRSATLLMESHTF